MRNKLIEVTMVLEVTDSPVGSSFEHVFNDELTGAVMNALDVVVAVPAYEVKEIQTDKPLQWLVNRAKRKPTPVGIQAFTAACPKCSTMVIQMDEPTGAKVVKCAQCGLNSIGEWKPIVLAERVAPVHGS